MKYERKQCGEERRVARVPLCDRVYACVYERVYTCLSRLWRFFSNTELGAAKKKIIVTVAVAAAVVVSSSADGNSYFSSYAIL